MFAQIKNIVEIASSGFKTIREFKTKRERDAAISDMLCFYFLLKDCVDEGETLILEAGSNPVAKIKGLSPIKATSTTDRWDVALRRQGVRLRSLQGLLFGQSQIAVINPALESALTKAIGYKMDRVVTLHGIGAALYIRCMFPIEESESDKARLVALMAGARSRGSIDLHRIRREVAALRESLDEYRSSLLLGVVVINLMLTYVVVLGGNLSDSKGRNFPFAVGFTALIVLAFPFFWMVDTKDIVWIWVAMLVMAAAFWLMWGAMPAYFAEVFPAQLRYTGISLGSQAATIIGGFVPLFATAMQPKYGTWPISAFVMAVEILGLIALMTLRRSLMRARPGVSPQPSHIPA